MTASGSLSIKKIPPGKESWQSAYKVLYESFGGASKWQQAPVEIAPCDGAPIGKVWCRNPSLYVFELQRPATVAQFSVAKIRPKSVPESYSMDGTVYRHFKASHAINGVPISKLMDDPSFTLHLVEKVNENSEQLVHVTYDVTFKSEPIIRGGELWLLPNQGWAIRKSRSDYLQPDRPSTSGRNDMSNRL